ncbi:MAG TPA: SRPBCC family protein [Gaiellaceae bacterium]|nr:SRPBCC family protein [Gaiellaceae bacterium]
MFGRNEARDAVVEVAETVAPYAEGLADDEKSRRRLRAVLEHGEAARRRARSQRGLSGTVLRLSTDRELHEHLGAMLGELQKLQRRVQRKRSHRLRNTLLLLLGGAGAAVAFVPQVRRKVTGIVGGATAPAAGPITIEEQVEVDVPVSTTYNQWTQFEDFPLFMEGVEHVRQIDDTTLHWVASVAGKQAEWDAKILEQVPDTRIAWESLDGRETRGTVRFDELGDTRTRIRLEMSYRPEGRLEKLGSAVGLDRRRIRGDLERFRELIEARGIESGAWRGEVHSGATG